MIPAEGFLSLSPERRALAFIQAATNKQVEAAILEKDFWVCWILGVIFADPELSPHFIFKGGTSLSKVYHVIDRFSEDVDLGIMPAFLGISEDAFSQSISRTSRTVALLDMQKYCGKILETRIVPRLENSVVEALGERQNGRYWLTYEFDERIHGPIVLFHYPSTVVTGVEYIQRNVKLEFGTLTDQRPIGLHDIRPWVAEAFPTIFTDWQCKVTALEMERTFWEKATILHAEHHRPVGREMPVRHARHYSDFSHLLIQPEADTFLTNKSMCLRVADWKDKVVARKWARYELARHGTFSLVPPANRLKNLEKDYDEMRPMFLREPQRFKVMMDILTEGEKRINSI